MRTGSKELAESKQWHNFILTLQHFLHFVMKLSMFLSTPRRPLDSRRHSSYSVTKMSTSSSGIRSSGFADRSSCGHRCVSEKVLRLTYSNKRKQ